MAENRQMPNGSTSTTRRIDAALLLLRLASGPAFLYHGSAILFGWFGGSGPARFASAHHWPLVMGYLVGFAQVAGGLAIMSGVLFRLGTTAVFIVMLGAIFLVHLRNGFDISNGGAEYALAQLLISGALLLLGPGRYSLISFAPNSVRNF
jgi:putative oxidoreductase